MVTTASAAGGEVGCWGRKYLAMPRRPTLLMLELNLVNILARFFFLICKALEVARKEVKGEVEVAHYKTPLTGPTHVVNFPHSFHSHPNPPLFQPFKTADKSQPTQILIFQTGLGADGRGSWPENRSSAPQVWPSSPDLASWAAGHLAGLAWTRRFQAHKKIPYWLRPGGFEIYNMF